MSEFKFSCPHCNQHLTATPEWAGHSLKCPACQNDFNVPSPDDVAGAPPVMAAPPKQPAAVSPRRISTPIAAKRPATSEGKTSGLAIAALVLGIVPCFNGIAAVICGHMALSRIKSGRAAKGKGLAIAGLVLGYIWLVLSLAALVWYLVVGRTAIQAAQKQILEMQKQQQMMQRPGGMPPMPNFPPNFPPAAQRGFSPPPGNFTPNAAPVLTLRVIQNTVFAPKQVYQVQMNTTGINNTQWQGSGTDQFEFRLDSDAVSGNGKLRVLSAPKVEITLPADVKRPFTLRLEGLRNITAKADGATLNLSEPLTVGEKKLVITGEVVPVPGGRRVQAGSRLPQNQGVPTGRARQVTTDPTKVTIPAQNASGTLFGAPFKCDKAQINTMMNTIEFREGTEFIAERSIMVFLFLSPGEKLYGRTFTADGEVPPSPHVHLKSGETVKILSDDYAVRLEFGELKNGRVSGKIYLEMPDQEQTKFSGTFNAVLDN